MKAGEEVTTPSGAAGVVESISESEYLGRRRVKPAIAVVRFPNGDRDTFHPSVLRRHQRGNELRGARTI